MFAPGDERERKNRSSELRARGTARRAGCWSQNTNWCASLYCFLLLIFVFLGVPRSSFAQAEGELKLAPPASLGDYQGRHIDEVRVSTLGDLWREPIEVRSVRRGDSLSGQLVRRALRELDRTGRYADLKGEILEEGARLVLHLSVRPRRLLDQVSIVGSAIERSEEQRVLALVAGDAVTDREIERARRDLIALYKVSGYPAARIELRPEDTDDTRRVILRINIFPGLTQRVEAIAFLVDPSPHHPSLGQFLDSYGMSVGDVMNDEAIQVANNKLTNTLVDGRFYEAAVSYKIRAGGKLQVLVQTGARFSVRIEGNNVFGRGELESELRLAQEKEARPELLEKNLRNFYVKRGFFDAAIRVERLDDTLGLATEIRVWVREGKRFRVVRREYPCLIGPRTAEDIDEEIEGVLSEQFPAATFLGGADPQVVDRATGSESATPRLTPYRNEPWLNFSAPSYAAVTAHLQKLYRTEGYLDARIGPATLVRRQCRRDSPPGECLLDGDPQLPQVDCAYPSKTDATIRQSCIPDVSRAIRCESEGILHLPIHPGKQAVLYDVSIEGNTHLTEEKIFKLAELPLGKPLRQADIEKALRRIETKYQEEAFAFAQIDSEIELSADHTRARLVISITERRQVKIHRIDIRGASFTREGLIRSRLSLKKGGLYRRSFVQGSQQRLESLGVFTNVSISLEDPGVPASEKVVMVTLSERLPQYLDIKGGFGSVDGFRIGFEYGHRNLGGEAIQFSLRSQLGLRPPFLIAESDVRKKYEELSALERMERRNTITLAFPEIGLGPLFRFEVELLDLGNNQRDFIQNRDAGTLRLLYRPQRQYLMQLGGSIERNNVNILGDAQGLDDFVQDSGQAIRVPEGLSIAYTQNLSASWDARDQSLSARKGFFLRATVEHVTARPLGDQAGQCDLTGVFDPVCSELLRWDGRVAGYLPLSKKGLTFALSFRAGTIQHLTSFSRTYPDRLFFMGGVDTLRGYAQDSLVPQDVADELLNPSDPDNPITIEQVVLRGGDIFVNPRAELRVPITSSIQTAFFLDAGNLWRNGSNFNPLDLRYTMGTGLRIETPVGPLVFDYGFNIGRILDALMPQRENMRNWEDLGAFHFSIGLF